MKGAEEAGAHDYGLPYLMRRHRELFQDRHLVHTLLVESVRSRSRHALHLELEVLQRDIGYFYDHLVREAPADALDPLIPLLQSTPQPSMKARLRLRNGLLATVLIGFLVLLPESRNPLSLTLKVLGTAGACLLIGYGLPVGKRPHTGNRKPCNF